jgi:hypothetical protein
MIQSTGGDPHHHPEIMTFATWIKTDEAKEAAKAWANIAAKLGWSDAEMEKQMRAAWRRVGKFAA